MKAIILSAGYATRLYPLTKNFPKALLTINDRPIIGYITDKLKKIREIDEIVVITNSRFNALFNKWARTESRNKGKKIRVINDLTKSEKDRLGAMGDLSFAINKLKTNSALLVIAGDNFFNFDLARLIKSARKNPQICIGVFDIKDGRYINKFGVVKMDKNNFITHFKEKPSKPFSSLVATGLYFIPGNKIGLINDYLNSADSRDAMGHFIEWLLKKTKVRGYPLSGIWHDIGSLESYEDAKNKFEDKKGQLNYYSTKK